MVCSWIESDAELRKTWKTLREQGGERRAKIQGWPVHLSQDFVLWLDDLMPIQDADAS